MQEWRLEILTRSSAACEALTRKSGVKRTTRGGQRPRSSNQRPGRKTDVWGTRRPIDIDSLSEEELIELNHKVVARLRFLSQMRSHSAMLDFRIGERVKFHPTGSPEVTGILTRYNKKTVTVVTDSGQHWNVAPGLLSRVDSGVAGNENSDVTGVVRFPNRRAGE
jgi:hypothetical protein